jgi:multidrug efflux system outer membrane protein
MPRRASSVYFGRMAPMLRAAVRWAWVISCVAGCMVGPDYKRPALPSTPSFRDQQAYAEKHSIADKHWWDVYGDPTLRALIQTGLQHNYDLASAVARVEQSRALAGVAGAQLWPAVGAGAGVSTQRRFNPVTKGPIQFPYYEVQAGFSWEIDLWGKLRRLRESALAQYLATEEARRGILVGLVAEIAVTYYQLLGLDWKLEIAQRAVKNREETLVLLREQEKSGLISHMELSWSEANVAEAARVVPDIQRQIRLRENQLSVLLGRPPEAIGRTARMATLKPSPDVPVGLPATLLTRRPDLRQAEAQLVAANAEVGAALAAYYPSLTLNGDVGLAATTPASLLSSNGLVYGIGGAFNLLTPILRGAEIRHRVAAQRAAFRALTANYRKALLVALQEVANALANIPGFRAAREQAQREVGLLDTARQMALDRFMGGVTSYMEILLVEQRELPAELILAELRTEEQIAFVRLYQSLGGGWDADAPRSTAPAKDPRAPRTTPSTPMKGNP